MRMIDLSATFYIYRWMAQKCYQRHQMMSVTSYDLDTRLSTWGQATVKPCDNVTRCHQVAATDGDTASSASIVYFLSGQGIHPDQPDDSTFIIDKTSGEIFVNKVSVGVPSYSLYFAMYLSAPYLAVNGRLHPRRGFIIDPVYLSRKIF